jgi:hypothetical protein
MSYNHRTTNIFTPSLDFWRSLEILLDGFPYKQGNASFLTKSEFIIYYETKYHERFDIDYNDRDVHGKPLTRQYIWSGQQRSYLDQIGSMERSLIRPNTIQKELNHLGRIIKFLSSSISDPDKVHQFQHFIEAVYYYLVDILNLNPDLPIIRQHGLDNQSNAQFQNRFDSFKNRDGGLLDKNQFCDRFNEICVVHKVPFIIFEFNNKCFVIHTTDIFSEKIIQELPLFLTLPELQDANQLFIDSYVLKTENDHKNSLAKAREGLESVRDYIYDRFNLTTSTSVHKDLEDLFIIHSSHVFDFTKIPEDNTDKLHKIVGYLRDSILLAVKMGNFGHHTITRPQLLDENISNLTLGLISSNIPFLIFLLI